MDIVNGIFEKSTWTKAAVARELNIYAQRLNGWLTEGSSPKVSKMVRILDTVGYELVVVPKGSKLPNGSEVVTLDPPKPKPDKPGRPRKEVADA